MALSGHVPDLGALEVLLGVAGTGSLNSAAQQIGVSQQAVSARIRAMEAQTGVPLVRRSPRGSALTPQGGVIAEWAARLLEVAAGLDAGIAALRADRRSRRWVSSSSTIAEQLLPGPRRRVGCLARAVVIVLVGVFVLKAAVLSSATQAKGLDAIFRSVAGRPAVPGCWPCSPAACCATAFTA